MQEKRPQYSKSGKHGKSVHHTISRKVNSLANIFSSASASVNSTDVMPGFNQAKSLVLIVYTLKNSSRKAKSTQLSPANTSQRS